MDQMRLEAVDRGVFTATSPDLVLLEIWQRRHHMFNRVGLEDDIPILVFELALAGDAKTVLAGEHNLALLHVELGLETLERARVLFDFLEQQAQRVRVIMMRLNLCNQLIDVQIVVDLAQVAPHVVPRLRLIDNGCTLEQPGRALRELLLLLV